PAAALVLEVDAEEALLPVVHVEVVLDVPLVHQDLRDGALQARGGDVDVGVAGLLGVADPGEVVRDGVGDRAHGASSTSSGGSARLTARGCKGRRSASR